jgi:hypothetical protein
MRLVSVQELKFLRSKGQNPTQGFVTNTEKYSDFTSFTGTYVDQKSLHGPTTDLNFNSWTDTNYA